MSTERPSWLGEQCPTWCVAEHGVQQQVEDRWHESAGFHVPVMELQTVRRDGGFRQDLVAEEFDVRLEQRVEQDEVFVLFGVGEQRERNFRLSVESVQWLIEALGTMVKTARASSG